MGRRQVAAGSGCPMPSAEQPPGQHRQLPATDCFVAPIRQPQAALTFACTGTLPRRPQNQHNRASPNEHTRGTPKRGSAGTEPCEGESYAGGQPILTAIQPEGQLHPQMCQQPSRLNLNPHKGHPDTHAQVTRRLCHWAPGHRSTLPSRKT